MVWCVAVQCSTKGGQGITMHRFPRDPERRKIWEQKVKRQGWKAHDRSFLCDVSRYTQQYILVEQFDIFIIS